MSNSRAKFHANFKLDGERHNQRNALALSNDVVNVPCVMKIKFMHRKNIVFDTMMLSHQ